ncbi:MAG: DUF262 domain-containing protein [Thermoguttaceae bacterium]|nr:DUF262 domain-containing protein [Thermoguttaceae bacterium]
MPDLLIPKEYSLEEIFQNRYNIPVYQRPYNWDSENVSQLLADIDDAFHYYIDNDRDKNAEDAILFIGTMFVMPDICDQFGNWNYSVVDGQQRITTLTLILMALLHHFISSGTDDNVIQEIRNLLWKKQGEDISAQLPVLTLGNIDKEILITLMDELFGGGDIIGYANRRLSDPQIKKVDERLLENLVRVSRHIENIEDDEKIVEYFNFIRGNVKAITVTINTRSKKLFSIFESINSKGKLLDEIDLIKSYIFQELDKSDHDVYLKKWGQLIRETDDRLQEYLSVYIRANIKYYKNEIDLKKFKGLTQNDFIKYYEKSSTREVLKAFVDDMLDNVEYFKMLSDYSLLRKEEIPEEALSFFIMNSIMGYKYTQPFLFKLLTLRFPYTALKTLTGTVRRPCPGKAYFRGELFESLAAIAFKFMLTFQSISGRESKDSAKTFQMAHEVLNGLTPTLSAAANLGSSDSERRKKEELAATKKIESIFEQAIHDAFVENGVVYKNIQNLHPQRGKISDNNTVKILFAYLNATDDQGKTDYHTLNDILSRHKAFKITTILQEDVPRGHKYKYYKVDETIYLEKGQDFIKPHKNKVPASEFLQTYIYRLGNLRLSWRNETVRSEAPHITLKDGELDYTCNQEVNDREKVLVDRLIRSPLIIRPDDYTPTVTPVTRPSVTIITRKNYSNLVAKEYKPVNFTLLGTKKVLDRPKWIQLVKEIMDTLFNKFENELVHLSNIRYKTSRGGIWISPDKNDLGDEPFHVGRNINVRSRFNGSEALSFCFEVISKLGLSKDDLTIEAERKR